MKNIEGGTEREQNVVTDSVNKLKEILTEFRMNEALIGRELNEAVRKARMVKRILGQCPVCQSGNLMVLYSKKSGKRFVGCTNFSKGLCDASFPLPQPPHEIKILRKTCKNCSWPVIAVRSKSRRYWNLCLNPDCPNKK